MENLLTNLNFYIALIGVILIISVYASKISEKIGLPLLLIFLAIGMLLGSDGIVGIKFDNPFLAQIIGTSALIFILYNGGLNTHYGEIKNVIARGVALASVGVLITAGVMAVFIYFMLELPWLHALLIGAIVSSTDAAAVFMILRSQKISIKHEIDKLLELESGSNDPMAIFLTIVVLELIVTGVASNTATMIMKFLLQFALGFGFGFAFGYAFPKICERLSLSQTGLYPLFSVAWMLIMFGVCSKLGGNGFLCIYVAGILTNKFDFANKESIIAFHEATAWMMQIVVFLVLGLLVFPSELLAIVPVATLLALALIFIARPLSVFAALAKSAYCKNEKFYISWVGLRGAVPIILATYPYVYGLEESHTIFNIVFFMVLFSVLLQGTSLNYVAKRLNIIQKDRNE